MVACLGWLQEYDGPGSLTSDMETARLLTLLNETVGSGAHENKQGLVPPSLHTACDPPHAELMDCQALPPAAAPLSCKLQPARCHLCMHLLLATVSKQAACLSPSTHHGVWLHVCLVVAASRCCG